MNSPVVELSVLLTELLCRLLFPVVDLSEPDTIVTIKLGGRPPGKLNQTREENDLEKTGRRDLEKPSDTIVNISELQVLGRGEVSIESPVVVVDECSEHGHHCDASVLALNSTVAEELGVIRDVSKRIEESKRGDSSSLSSLEKSSGGSLRRKNKRVNNSERKNVSLDNLRIGVHPFLQVLESQLLMDFKSPSNLKVLNINVQA